MRKFITALLLGASLCTATLVRGQYNRDYFYYVGRTFMIDNNFEDAIRTLNVLLRFDDDAYEGYFLRGIAKFNLDDLLGAEADFTTAIEKNPVFTTAYTYRAITRSRLGNYDDALNDFREAIELRPDLPGPYFSRGVTRLLNQQFELAIADFDKFIMHEDKVADAYIDRGICYLQLKDTVRAYENFDQAIRTNREDPNGYNRRGELLMRQQRMREAEEDFDRAVACDSSYLLAFFNRAIVYADTHRPMLALSDLDHVLKLDSTNSLTYFNRAIVRTQIGDYNRALEDYDKVARYSPDNVLVYFNRALLQSNLGNLKAAEADYTHAISLYPDFANAYLNRGNLRYLMQDFEGARRDRQTAQRKIAEYKSRLSDSTYSIYADTTHRFDRLLSFDSNLAGSSFGRITSKNDDRRLALLPLFRFTLQRPDSAAAAEVNPYRSQRAEDFRRRIANPDLALSARVCNISPDTLMTLDRRLAQEIRTTDPSWELLFQRGITQTLIKQYTNAVNTFTEAIARNAANPFLYLNRSATRAEMIDFISSIDNSYQRIAIESDPARRLQNSQSRTYDYDEAIADLDEAARLYPDFPYTYYNRANLLALSGKLPEAYADYTRAIELAPSFAEAYYNRGLVQIYMKDTRKGYLDLSKAGELGIKAAYEMLRQYARAGAPDE